MTYPFPTRCSSDLLEHPHHDQPRCDEIAERHAHHLRPSASAQSDGKNDEIEQRRDRRCPDRLELDLEEPPHLLHIERAKPAPIDVPDHGHAGGIRHRRLDFRSEEHTSELQSLMRISYAVFCLKK